jgi:predicted transposase YdaD
LEGYRAFIGKVRGYRGEGKSLEEAIGAAVVYCRSHEILKEFLERHGTEVMGMLTAEWKLDEALAVQYKEGREKGQEEGWEKGQEKFARNALAEGMSPDAISRITGLDIAIVKELAGR